jgi:hypothetical protein
MNKQSAIILISVVIVTVLGVMVLRSSSDQMVQPQPAANQQATTTENESGIVRTIDAVHQYQPDQGRHIVAGTTTVPTPCHQLSAETEVRESSPEEVIIDFASEQNDEEMCAQVIQNRRFKVVFEASEDAVISGGMFGEDRVELNLREAQPGQNLDDFQVYTKG